MKIAIPTANGKLCMHFGHCQTFALLDVNADSREILEQQTLTPPPHEPGVLPRWLGELDVQVILAGGMGQRAQQLFEQQNIEVVVGAPAEAPGKLATDYLTGALQSGTNVCDH